DQFVPFRENREVRKAARLAPRIWKVGVVFLTVRACPRKPWQQQFGAGAGIRSPSPAAVRGGVHEHALARRPHPRSESRLLRSDNFSSRRRAARRANAARPCDPREPIPEGSHVGELDQIEHDWWDAIGQSTPTTTEAISAAISSMDVISVLRESLLARKGLNSRMRSCDPPCQMGRSF